MSTALLDARPEPEPNDPSVSEWIGRITANLPAPDQATDDDPLVARICSAAVDPLEIAAALEAAGMSHQVVVDTFGQADVFALAEQLWTHVPFEPSVVSHGYVERAGNWRDLARGALYASPAFILFALTRALGVELAWWALPLAMTWGWALGQVTAFTGYTLRGRGHSEGEAQMGAWLMTFAAASTALLACLTGAVIGGGLSSIVAATGVTAYMVANAIMLLHNEEHLAALLLCPAGAVSAITFALGSTGLTDALAVAIIIPCGVATFVAAGRHLRFTSKNGIGLGPADVRVAMAHLVHGTICGLALSLVAIQGARLHSGTVRAEVIAVPLLMTLGVMEWQLRTFKAGVGRLMRRYESLDDFKPEAWALFQRSFRIYASAVLLVSAVIALTFRHYDIHPPYIVLGTQVALALAFFLDLTITSTGRLDAVLRCWFIAVAAGLWYAGWAAVTTDVAGDILAWRSASIAALVACMALLDCAREVAAAAISQ
jgi:hypothetical protein